MDFEKSRLERLKRSLYSRNEESLPKDKRTPVADREYDVKNNWGDTPSYELSPDVMRKQNNSFFNNFFLISVIFFVVALAIASFIFFGGFNSISSNNVDIKITGPSTISSGQELDADLSIINSNRANLSNVVLYIDYPDGSQSVVKSGTPLTHDTIKLDTLSQGQSKSQSLQAIFFGDKGKVMSIKMRLEYTTAGSNAVFSKEKTYDVTIDSSPILLNVSYPKEINSGQDVALSIDITSNSTAVIQNVLVKVSYPYGYTYKSSTATPINKDNTIWKIGDLKGGDKKNLTITGTLVGQNLEDRSFNVSVGTGSTITPNDFSTNLAVDQATIGIRKSFFDLSVSSSNSSSGNELGQNVPVSIQYHNTLPDKTVDNIVTAKISGNVFDPSGVSTDGMGYYQSGNSTITWNKNSSIRLSALNPGDDGTVSFNLVSIPVTSQSRSIKNPHIDISVVMNGSRTGSDSSDVTSTANTTIKFISDLELSAKSYRNVGPFTNTGPIPLKADVESTYTVTWVLTNTSNDLSGTVVSAVLPVGIVWKNMTSPSGEHISFDSNSRVVTWNAGTVSSGTGFTNSARSASFQVGVTPSLTQVGQAIDLVKNISAVSTDTYVGSAINISAQNITTHFSDPNFQNGADIVGR